MGEFIDLRGQRFGRLIAEMFTHVTLANGRRMPAWRCACNCGNVTIVQGHHLRGGKSQSCGCTAFGEKKPGGNRQKWGGYGVWQQMNYRCYNPNVKSYKYYGERGIRVCDRWRGGVIGFENFIADMGSPLPGFTIDRIDPNGNYEPSNCRWATDAEQRLNTRRSIHAVIGGVRVPLIKYSARTGVDYERLRVRVRHHGETVLQACRYLRQRMAMAA